MGQTHLTHLQGVGWAGGVGGGSKAVVKLRCVCMCVCVCACVCVWCFTDKHKRAELCVVVLGRQFDDFCSHLQWYLHLHGTKGGGGEREGR